jgi:hypothetical protein
LWMEELVMFLWWNMQEKLSIQQRQQLLPIQLSSSDHMTAAAAVLVTELPNNAMKYPQVPYLFVTLFISIFIPNIKSDYSPYI